MFRRMRSGAIASSLYTCIMYILSYIL